MVLLLKVSLSEVMKKVYLSRKCVVKEVWQRVAKTSSNILVITYSLFVIRYNDVICRSKLVCQESVAKRGRDELLGTSNEYVIIKIF